MIPPHAKLAQQSRIKVRTKAEPEAPNTCLGRVRHAWFTSQSSPRCFFLIPLAILFPKTSKFLGSGHRCSRISHLPSPKIVAADRTE
jgi:hypothetical protein